jgi:molybdopterin/thiamine biosynthesis adenylyltransferase
MKKIAIVGAGGINSWACKFLNELFNKLEDTEYIVQVFDNDIVEEKNILSSNQNYDTDDLMEPKAESLASKYGFMHDNCFITEENIDEKLGMFDDIILGVDNNKVRRLVYDYCISNNKYLLDMRAQGTQIAFYIIENNTEKTIAHYDQKLFSNAEVMERKGSCQLQHDIDNDHIEMGNYIIACMGINACYLKHIRNEKLTTNEYRFAY